MDPKILEAAGVMYKYPEEITFIKEEYRKEEIVAMATLANPNSELQKIKKARETVDLGGEPVLTFLMCLAAVANKARELRHVPANLKTEEVCLAAFQFGKLTPDRKSMSVGFREETKFRPLLAALPKKLDTPEFYLKILSALKERDPYGMTVCDAFNDMIARMQEKGIALKEYYEDEELTPSEKAVVDFCTGAVSIYPDIIRELPLRYVTDEAMMIAVDRNGGLLPEINNRFLRKKNMPISDELWATALESSLGHIRYLPNHLSTREFILGCLERGEAKGKQMMDGILPIIPEEDWFPGLLDAIRKRYGKRLIAFDSFFRIPEKYLTHDFCVECAAENHRIFKSMSNAFRDREVCEAAVKNYLWAIRDVPEEYRDEQMYRFLLDCHSYTAVAEIPAEYIDTDTAWKLIMEGKKEENHVGAALVDEFSRLFEKIKGTVNTEERCLAILKIANDAFGYSTYKDFVAEYIPEYLKTRKVCETIVHPYMDSAQRAQEVVETLIPEGERSAMFAILFQENRTFSLLDIDRRYWTPEIMLASVKNNPDTIKDVPIAPEGYREFVLDNLSTDMRRQVERRIYRFDAPGILFAFNKMQPSEWRLSNLIDVFSCEREAEGDRKFVDLARVPAEMKTEDFYEKMVEANPSRFSDVPEDKLTQSICKKAIYGCASMILDVPESMATEEMWKDAILTFPTLREHLPENFRTQDFYDRLVDEGLTLQLVPEKFRTREICFKAAAKNIIGDWKYVPVEVWDGEFMRAALATNDSVERIQDILKAVPISSRSIDREIFYEAVKHRGEILNVFPACFMTEEIAETAVRQRVQNFFYLPAYLRSPELCALALEKAQNEHEWKSVFQGIPIYNLTPAICREAMENPLVDKGNVPIYLVSEKEETQAPAFRL